MAGYIGTQAVSVNTTSATISDDLAVGDDLTVTDDAAIGGTLAVTGILTTTAKAVSNGGIGIPDDVKLTFGGTGTGDLQIFHDATNSFSAISDQGTGPLVILSNNLLVQNAGGTENMIKALDGGAVELLHNNVKKLETTAAGITVTGTSLAANGTASLPTHAFSGDPNTGMFLNSADTLAFSTGGTQRAFLSATQLNVTGNAIFAGTAHTFAGSATLANNLTLTDGNLTVASGNGINFTATGDGAGTDASELLDDYEEGQWTPAPTRTSSAPTVGFSAGPNGSYIKVGRMVYASFDMTINSYSGGGGTAQLNGLPYAASNDLNSFSGFGVLLVRDSSAVPVGPTATTTVKGFVQRGASHISVQYDNIGNAGSNTNSNVANWQQGRFTGYMMYPASS